MTFAQRRNRLTTHFSESIPVVKRRISVLFCCKRGHVKAYPYAEQKTRTLSATYLLLSFSYQVSKSVSHCTSRKPYCPL